MWGYSQNIHRPATIRALAQNLIGQLREIVSARKPFEGAP